MVFVLSSVTRFKRAVHVFTYRYKRIRDPELIRVTKMWSPAEAARFAFKEAWRSLWK